LNAISKKWQLSSTAGAVWLYGDGANANAFLGKIRPGDLGFDIIQLNLHKTFSTHTAAAGQAAARLV